MRRSGYLKLMGIAALVIIVIALIIGITGMYRSSLTSFRLTTDNLLSQAVETEFNMRKMSLGDQFEHWFGPSGDTSAYITKTIQAGGTSIIIQIRRDDPKTIMEMAQYEMRHSRPININRIDSLLRKNLSKHSMPFKSTYIDYLDLNLNFPLRSTAPINKGNGYITSHIDTLDVFKSLGVRAHVQIPVFAILQPVLFRIILSVVLILIALFCIFKLIKDVLGMYKEEFKGLWSFIHGVEKPVLRVVEKMRMTAEQRRQQKMQEEAESVRRAYLRGKDAGSRSARLWLYIDNEEKKVKVVKNPVKIKRFLEALKKQFEAKTSKKVSVHIRCSDDLVLNTDVMFLEIVLDELINNSIRFSDETVHIDIIVEREEKHIILTVRDNGWGIPREEAETVFRLSYKIAEHASRLEEDEGMGLGLSFVESFVQSLGGTINLVSMQNHLTMFRITFPLF